MAKAGRKKKDDIDLLIQEREKEIEKNNSTSFEETKVIEEKLTISQDIISAPTSAVDEPTLVETTNGKEIPEVMQIISTSLSEQAIKWEKYIAMYRMTPEIFLEKYPYHIHRKFIEEIIEVRKSK